MNRRPMRWLGAPRREVASGGLASRADRGLQLLRGEPGGGVGGAGALADRGLVLVDLAVPDAPRHRLDRRARVLCHHHLPDARRADRYRAGRVVGVLVQPAVVVADDAHCGGAARAVGQQSAPLW